MNSLVAIGVLRRVAVTGPLGTGQVGDLTLTEQVRKEATREDPRVMDNEGRVCPFATT